MTDKHAHVARIAQNGHLIGFIRLDQSVKWISPLKGGYLGQEKQIESIASESLGSLAARGAILAALELADIYKGTEITFTLLVDTMFGTDPDVIT